jgi:hypothetical protein
MKPRLWSPHHRIQSHSLASQHYFCAMILEALKWPDDALAEYVALYRAAPDSAWGRLAALHVEQVK